MPSLDERFECYIANVEKCDLHPSIKKVRESFPDDISKMPHLLFNGPPGIGKYTQALTFIHKHSPSALRYEKRMEVAGDKTTYSMKISDVHFEVDMETLGCHSRTMWSTIHSQVVDAVRAKTPPIGFIICRNFHKTHKELLEVFYYYMATPEVRLILISEHIGFLPRRIIDRCFRIPMTCPPNSRVRAGGINSDSAGINMKATTSTRISLSQRHESLCGGLVSIIISSNPIDYAALRNMFYDVLIQQHHIPEMIWVIVRSLVQSGKINNDKLPKLFDVVCRFYRLYNNNYRPIYHLECFALEIRKIIRSTSTSTSTYTCLE